MRHGVTQAEQQDDANAVVRRREQRRKDVLDPSPQMVLKIYSNVYLKIGLKLRSRRFPVTPPTGTVLCDAENALLLA